LILKNNFKKITNIILIYFYIKSILNPNYYTFSNTPLCLRKLIGRGGKYFLPSQEIVCLFLIFMSRQNNERSKQLARQTFSTRTDYLAFSNISQQKPP